MNNLPHIPVLFHEVIDAFSSIDKGWIVDCTLGYGGHSFGILEAKQYISLLCNDQDDEALLFSKERLKPYLERIEFKKGNFENVAESFVGKNIKGILADIGVSSLQLDKTTRGFGFLCDTLDMRMDQNQELSATDVVNNYPLSKLETILKEYGEVSEYKKVASLIFKNRPFSSSKELAILLEKNLYKGKIHPATLPFQAIRIEVNDELGVLERLFLSLEKEKLQDCIVAIISFHSLEDRIVKNYFKKWSQSCICPSGVLRCECENNHQKGKIITKKPITARQEEIKRNPGSRSAKLRIFQFIQ